MLDVLVFAWVSGLCVLLVCGIAPVPTLLAACLTIVVVATAALVRLLVRG